jgi:hypothetical protein
MASTHNVLVRAIRHAEANDRVGRNVASLVKPPQGKTGRPSRAMTAAEAAALLVAAKDHPRLGVRDPVPDHRDPDRGGPGAAMDHVDLDGDPDARLPVPPSIAEYADDPLLAAVSAWRLAACYDRAATETALAKARGIADRTGETNHMDTAFGPVNVAIHAMCRKDAAAVNLLLAAERLSPQLVRYDQATRDVLTELLRREHRPSTPELRPLARRAGVI